MKADPKIETAIEEAVRAEGQADALCRRLVAWFTDVAAGNEFITDSTAAMRRARLLYEKTDPSAPIDTVEHSESIHDVDHENLGATE